ncbi:hypothetical protein HG531_000432 [Fusarium graminearum]|nr:hypothetical protein HG531_000432 [Fusarium graminearum]
MSFGWSARSVSLSERLAGVLAREGGPGLEAGERHGSTKSTSVISTLAPNTSSDRSVLEEMEVSLGHLPELDTSNKHDGEANGQSPLPGDACVLEELVVQDRDVDNREDRQTAKDDGPEEEAVGVDILENRESAVIIGVEAENGAAQTLELPGRDEDEPSEFGKCSGTSFENGDTSFGVSLVALLAQVSTVSAVDDNNECAHGASTHNDTVDNHINNDLVGKDTALLVLRRFAHDILSTLLTTKSEGREGGSSHVDPDDLQRRDGENGKATVIDKGKTTHQKDNFTDIGGKKMQDKLLDVVKHATTFTNSGDDRVKLVISEHDLGSRLGNIRTRTHSNTDIGTRKRGGVVDTITSHGHKGTTSTKSVDHASLGVGSTTGDNQRKFLKSVNLLISHAVKVSGLLNNGLGDVIRQDAHILGNNTNFLSNSLGSFRMVTSKHVNTNTSVGTLSNRWLGFATRGIVDTSKTKKDEALFDLSTKLLILGGAVSDSENTLTLRSKVVHLSEDGFLEFFSHGLLVGSSASVVAKVQNTFDSTLGKDHGVLSLNNGSTGSLRGIVNNRHALDGAVKGEFGSLLPALAFKSFLARVEAVGKDLKGNLGGLASNLPFLLLLIVANCSQVAEGRREQESVELIGHFTLNLRLGLLGRSVVVLVKLLIGHIKLEYSSTSLAVVVTRSRRLFGLGIVLLGVGDSALRWVVGALRVADSVDVGRGDPGLANNHGTLGQSTSLVGANVCDSSESLEGRKITDDDVGLSHNSDGNDHGNSQDSDQGLGDNGDTQRSSVNDDLVLHVKLVDSKHNNGEDDGTAKENVGKGRELSLTDERLLLSIFLVVHGATGLACLLGGRSGNLADLGGHTSRSDNTTTTTLSDNGSSIGHVDTVTNTDLILRLDQLLSARSSNIVIGDLFDGDGFASELTFLAGKVHGFEETEIGRDSVAHLKKDDISGNDFGAVELSFRHGEPWHWERREL